MRWHYLMPHGRRGPLTIQPLFTGSLFIHRVKMPLYQDHLGGGVPNQEEHSWIYYEFQSVVSKLVLWEPMLETRPPRCASIHFTTTPSQVTSDLSKWYCLWFSSCMRVTMNKVVSACERICRWVDIIYVGKKILCPRPNVRAGAQTLW